MLLEGFQGAGVAIIKMFVDEREDLVFEIRGVDIEAFPSDGASQGSDFRGVRIRGFRGGGVCEGGLNRFQVRDDCRDIFEGLVDDVVGDLLEVLRRVFFVLEFDFVVD